MLATASLNQPAGRPGGESLLPAGRGDVQDAGQKPQASRNAEAEAKHAARLASTGTGARAAAMAALRASRRKAAARLPAPRLDAHDSASQTAAHRVRDSTSQTGFRSAVHLHDQPSAVRATVSTVLRDAHPAMPLPDVPRQGTVSGGDGVASSVPDTAAERTEQHGPASSRAALFPLTLSSPPRRGREPLQPSSPQAPDDLALQMGLPLSPQLPGRHRSGVPLLGRGGRSSGTLLPRPAAATAAVAVAAAVAVLPRPGQPLAWTPPSSAATASRMGHTLQPPTNDAFTSILGTDSTLPAVSDSIGDSLRIRGDNASVHVHHSTALQAASAPGVEGNGGIATAAQEGLDRNPAAPHAGAGRAAVSAASGAPRSGSRPDLVSDIEALRRRWAVACEPTAARHRRPGALEDYPRRLLSRLFGRLHSCHPALAASSADLPCDGGGGDGAGYSSLRALPPAPGIWGVAPRGLNLRCSYPGADRSPEACVWLLPLFAEKSCVFSSAERLLVPLPKSTDHTAF